MIKQVLHCPQELKALARRVIHSLSLLLHHSFQTIPAVLAIQHHRIIAAQSRTETIPLRLPEVDQSGDGWVVQGDAFGKCCQYSCMLFLRWGVKVVFLDDFKGVPVPEV